MMKSTLIKDLYGEIERLKAGRMFLHYFYCVCLKGKIFCMYLHWLCFLYIMIMFRGLCSTWEKWCLHPKGEILSGGEWKEGNMSTAFPPPFPQYFFLCYALVVLYINSSCSQAMADQIEQMGISIETYQKVCFDHSAYW